MRLMIYLKRNPSAMSKSRTEDGFVCRAWPGTAPQF